MTRTAPWSKDTPASVAADVQALVFETLRQAGILLQPVMSDKATMLLDALGVPTGRRSLADAAFARSEEGAVVFGDVRPGVRLFDVDMAKL